MFHEKLGIGPADLLFVYNNLHIRSIIFVTSGLLDEISSVGGLIGTNVSFSIAPVCQPEVGGHRRTTCWNIEKQGENCQEPVAGSAIGKDHGELDLSCLGSFLRDQSCGFCWFIKLLWATTNRLDECMYIVLVKLCDWMLPMGVDTREALGLKPPPLDFQALYYTLCYI